MERINTQLPEVALPQPQSGDWFSRHRIWGYGFLLLSFALAVAFIYQMQFGSRQKEARICVQMVTRAQNEKTGEIVDYPTPCDVPDGWKVLPLNPSLPPF